MEGEDQAADSKDTYEPTQFRQQSGQDNHMRSRIFLIC